MIIHCIGRCLNTLYIYVIDYMRTRFICALSVTICEILAIKYIARIDAYCARIVSSIPRIVSDCLRIVSPKLADTSFGRSLSHWRPFLVLFLCHNEPIGIFKKVVRRWGSLFAHCRSDRTACQTYYVLRTVRSQRQQRMRAQQLSETVFTDSFCRFEIYANSS